jgi:hypothetical protein
MISKCANPACSVRFHYMRAGKLFRMEFDPDHDAPGPQLAGNSKPVRKIEHFWLCGSCSTFLTLVMNAGKVEAVPIEAAGFGRAAS